MTASKPESSSKTVPSERNGSTWGYVIGGLSYIPLIGVLFGCIAILIGLLDRSKRIALLGAGGILFSVILYGCLFYFGFIAKFGPFVEIKKQLTSQLLNDTKTKILAYKATHDGKLPTSLEDLGASTQQNPVYTTDAWNHPISYLRLSNGGFILTSNGLDGLPNTADDISVTQE